MTPEDVKKALGDTPFMDLDQGREVTRFIRQQRIRDVLELGFAHGASTCYLAAALADTGGGSIVTVDTEEARGRDPNIDELLSRCGLQGMVTRYFEPSSYNWRLMKLLEADPTPRFDFCYLDGSHTWAVDALAFFLVDRLLRPGGWILFDDLEFTWDSLEEKHGHDAWFRAMPGDERRTKQIRKVCDLLVKTHPGYDEFRLSRHDWWLFAHKRRSRLWSGKRFASRAWWRPRGEWA